jgi:mannitol/fructose-specific phosphotransferase system IIA component (Ntr-type)
LSGVFPEGCILADLKSSQKEDAIHEMVAALVAAGKMDEASSKKVFEALIDREKLGSSGIGGGVAVPHAKHESVRDLVGVMGRSKKGINFDALDGEPVYVLFLLLSSKSASGTHLEALAYISRLVRDENFLQRFRQAESDDEFRDLLGGSEPVY